MSDKKKVLLFSTLNPFPFWAGSENFWFDFVRDERINREIEFTIALAKSPTTIEKGRELESCGAKAEYYNHFNVSFARRNIYRLLQKASGNTVKKLPWYNRIRSGNFDLVWFNVAGLDDLINLQYPVSLCKKKNIPYWIILQHGFEDFFLTSKEDIDIVTEVSTGAKKFIFIADRNRLSLERAIGQKLKNAVRSVNAISNDLIVKAEELNAQRAPSSTGTAKFFNLGRFSPKDKAQHLLVQALAGPNWEARDWQLSFIGVADFGQYYIRKLCGYFGLNENRVKILPFTKDVLKSITENDVLLMPSIAEGTPYAMIESMACGRPALGTPVGGIPELINDGKTGWLSGGIQVEDISQKLEALWNDRQHWAKMGNLARTNIAQHYNQKQSHLDLLELLRNDIR